MKACEICEVVTVGGHDSRLHRLADRVAKLEAERVAPTVTATPIPMRLACPECRMLHIDEGEFATKPHHTHSCQGCGLTWRPAVTHTVGVQFLPGFKNVPVATAERSDGARKLAPGWMRLTPSHGDWYCTDDSTHQNAAYRKGGNAVCESCAESAGVFAEPATVQPEAVTHQRAFEAVKTADEAMNVGRRQWVTPTLARYIRQSERISELEALLADFRQTRSDQHHEIDVLRGQLVEAEARGRATVLDAKIMPQEIVLAFNEREATATCGCWVGREDAGNRVRFVVKPCAHVLDDPAIAAWRRLTGKQWFALGRLEADAKFFDSETCLIARAALEALVKP